MTAHDYELWFVAPHHLSRITAERARDLMIDCIMVAHKDNLIGRTGRSAGALAQHAVRDAAAARVRAAFTELGYDFALPDASNCRMVAEHLTLESRKQGVPSEVIEHHAREYGKVLEALEGVEG